MMWYVRIAAVCLFIANGTKAQELNKERLDSLIVNLEHHNKAMGTVLISQKGNVLYERAFGYRFVNGSEKLPLNNDTKYRIGSVTKVFTAVLIFQLVEEGKLTLDAPLSAFFPKVQGAEKITIRHLLSHQSGLYNYTTDWDSWRLNPKSQNDMVALIGAHQLQFEPGTKTSYSNSNYVLLGYIIEKITNQSYGAVVKKRITGKYKLDQTYYGSKTDTKKNEAFSYAAENGAWMQQPETHVSAAHGAGGIVATAANMNRFMELLFAGKLISKSNLDLMLQTKDGEGMGMQQLPFFNYRLYGHSGMIDYFQSYVLYFPEEQVSVTYLSNGYGGESINEILKGILHIIFNKPFQIPDYRSVALTAEEQEKLLGVYASKQPPMKISIIKEGTALYAQAEGQAPFPLRVVQKGEFRYDAAGIVLKFSPLFTDFTLTQGGADYLFTKVNQ